MLEAGVVDEDVDAADTLDDARDVAALRQVGSDLGVGGRRVERLPRQIDDDHLRAPLGEIGGDRQSDAARAAGDERPAAVAPRAIRAHDTTFAPTPSPDSSSWLACSS